MSDGPVEAGIELATDDGAYVLSLSGPGNELDEKDLIAILKNVDGEVARALDRRVDQKIFERQITCDDCGGRGEVGDGYGGYHQIACPDCGNTWVAG